MRRIVLTGATGFVGANLARALLEIPDIELCITARSNSDFTRISELRRFLHRIDFLNLDHRNEVFHYMNDVKPELVYHVATYGGLPAQSDAEQMVRTNLQSTMHLLDAAVECGVKQFIHTGSSSEYGVKLEPMKEDDYCQPLSVYGITKLAATHYCTLIGRTTDLRTCTLRLFSPYGSYEDPSRLYPSIKNALLQNQPPRLSRPDSVRDFIPVERVASIYLRISQTNYESGTVINVGSGRQQTIEQFYTKIAAEMNKSHIVPIWGLAAPRPNEPVVWQADITRLKQLFAQNERV